MANDGWKLVNPKTRTYQSLATGELYSYRRYRESVLLGKKLEQYASERKEEGVVTTPPSRKILNNDIRANEAFYLINKGYSAKDAARKVGLSNSTISNRLKNHKNASADAPEFVAAQMRSTVFGRRRQHSFRRSG